jgi:rhodanese-related sulfurtransferase
MVERFAHQGLVVNGLIHLSPKEALAALEQGALLVDVREDYLVSMKGFDVREVRCLPFSRFQADFEQLPRNRPLILADAVGMYSREAAAILLEHGFPEVASLNGGISSWEDEHLPLQVDPANLLQGGCACQLKPRREK